MLCFARCSLAAARFARSRAHKRSLNPAFRSAYLWPGSRKEPCMATWNCRMDTRLGLFLHGNLGSWFADGATLSAGKSASFLGTEEWHRQVGGAEASLKLRVLFSHFTLPLLVRCVVFVTSNLGSALNPLLFIICSFVRRPQGRITALASPPMLLCFLSLVVGRPAGGVHPQGHLR